MMNKFFAIMIAAVLALSCTAAFAATYTHEDDIRFEFDDAKFEITMDEFTAMPDAKDLTQGEWNGFKDVFMYTVENEDGASEHFFIAPVTDDDGEVEDILTIEIGVTAIEDEDAAMERDDLISAVVDSLKIDD